MSSVANFGVLRKDARKMFFGVGWKMLPMWECCQFQCCQWPMGRAWRPAGDLRACKPATPKRAGAEANREVSMRVWSGSMASTVRRPYA